MSGDRVMIAPSLLAADAADLAAVIEALESEAEIFHVDVMDGHFVPNLSMGPHVARAVRRRTRKIVDVHLMVDDPNRWIGPFRDAGADWISVHTEATPHLQRTLAAIRESGARAGAVLNPGTPPDGLEYVLEDGDFVLVMSVNPGYGGQKFLPRSIDKIAAVASVLSTAGLEGVDIEVDGGIDIETAPRCVAVGATVLVAGSSITGTADPGAAAARLRSVAEAALSARVGAAEGEGSGQT